MKMIWNRLFLYRDTRDPEGIVFAIFLCFAHGFGFLRLGVCLGESLGFFPLEEIESFVGFEYNCASISDLEVAVGALDFACYRYFSCIAFLFAFSAFSALAGFSESAAFFLSA